MCRQRSDIARGRDRSSSRRCVLYVLLLAGTLLSCDAGGNGTPDVYRILGGARTRHADYDYPHMNDIEDAGRQGDLYIGRSGDPWSASSASNYEKDILLSVPSSANDTKVLTVADGLKETSTHARFKRGVIHLYNMVVCATGCNPLAYKGYGCYCGFLGSGYVIDGAARCTIGVTTPRNARCSRSTSCRITGDVITVTNPFARLNTATGEDLDLALNACANAIGHWPSA
ncbi:PREDICTED: uncharacterized protein LOC106745007 isoform X2 [Dinoponera quadriceps]|uniref:Uncharacterized protein LOC106745007 isoform X2 n=1 Tax=Dinoponera quadriceps TaxID=609295 RepID=A0A6P3XBP3_DINQU|nr:PREDICTED: uncharacterized protein LOC106745007 isoform X2 [Dinoponera quadriceps]